ncbi:transporter substrate-binding domain-containing protein [Jatrophihabitans cynanchi]|uniref:Transporter substrate-binding domain-containing protein n=1 Tax=Jatrophihabitans cynanchi TaxID=2944128 RepID=A0ABY7K2B2_9ACTN|nr:transporter substrate-binding domain-containing protein [Jatrophihabitans sp. SB3-54]WAX58962.1 transporter substrate-binding domain-containing protein [Jatrophihabitans sp. SB3-54]
MARHSRGIRLAALIAAAASATALSACSSSGDSSPSPANGSSVGAGSPVGTGSSAGGTSAYAGKTIAVAAVSDYPPISFADAGSTKIKGVAVDILQALADEMGAKFDLQNTSFDSLIPSLQAGRQLIASGGTTDTPTNEKATIMVDFMQTGVQMIVPAGNPKGIKGLDAACGFTIAVLAGSPTYQGLINDASDACTKAGNKKINMSTFKTADEALLAVKAGRADAEVDSSILQSYRIQQGVKIEVIGENLAPHPIAFQVLPSNQPLADALKTALQGLMDNGKYKAILAQWKMESGALPAAGINLGANS